MTRTMSELHALAARGAARGIEVKVYSQFSEDLPGDLTRHVLTAEPDLVVLSPSTEYTPHDLFPRTVVFRGDGPSIAAAVAVHQQSGADGGAAMQVAAQIAVTRGLPLVLVGGHGRRERGTVAALGRHGIDVQAGEVPDVALIVGTAADVDAHLIVHGRRDDEIDNINDWASLVSAERQA